MYLNRILLSITLVLFTLTFVKAQFIDPGSDHARIVHRNIGTSSDSTFIYVFFTPKQGVSQYGRLKATSLDGEDANFNWYKFNQLTNTVNSNPFYSSTGTTSEVGSLEEGGYMVVLSQEIETVTQRDTFYSWVFLDTLQIQSINVEANTCDNLRLRVESSLRTQYTYSDFSRPSEPPLRLFITNRFSVKWSADEDIRDGIKGDNSWQTITNQVTTRIADPAPLVRSKYNAEITNIFGQTTRFASAEIPVVAVYAKMIMLRPDESNFFAPSQEFEGEALYKLKLNNDSRNADVFEWTGFGNQNINFERDRVIWTSDKRDITEELVYKPGKYPIRLHARSSKTGCESVNQLMDENDKDVYLNVLHSKFDANSIPNAFSPNGDGRNDIFQFVEGQRPVSIRNIDVKIFGRNGNQVYKYFGDIHQWKGWNGQINGSGAECASGVYFYILKGDGWDDVGYSGKQYTGSLHLFRGN